MSSAAVARHVEQAILKNHFAVLATIGADGRPDSAGVSYAAVREHGTLVLYLMTRRHLRKARDIADRPEVSLVVPIARRVLWFVPPATIQLTGRALLLSSDDASGRAAFAGFTVGRRVLSAYDRMISNGERRVCFVRITLDPTVRTYMVGMGLWRVMRHMEYGARRLELGRTATGDGRAVV